jgi:hypothetical protein
MNKVASPTQANTVSGEAGMTRTGWQLHVWWAVSVFLIGLGVKLYYIFQYGSGLPYYDQWLCEAVNLYVPYIQNKLQLENLFAANNEHRIFFTHVYDLALFVLNGQWDNLLQLVCNAIIYSAGIAGFGWFLAELAGKKIWLVIWLPLVLMLVLPFTYENTLWGLQSSFYFMMLLSLLTIGLLGLSEPKSRGWWMGLLAAVATLVTVASGFLAAVALVLLDLLKDRKNWRQYAPTLASCMVLTVIGVMIKVDVPRHHQLAAHSLAQFVTALAQLIAWPNIFQPWLVLINPLPIAAIAWIYVRSNHREMRAERIVLGVGSWVILQAAAVAYTRSENVIVSRYMDFTVFLMVLNCVSLYLLLSRYRQYFKFRALYYAGAAAWLGCCLYGLWFLNGVVRERAFPKLRPLVELREENTRAFMVINDEHVFDDKDPLLLAFPDGATLVGLLRKDAIRSMLPACVRDPLKVSEKGHGTFIHNGWQLDRPDGATEKSWGSYSLENISTPRSFESLPVKKSAMPYLEIPVAGDLGEPGLSLELVDMANGRRTRINPTRPPGGHWVNIQVPAPEGEFKIVARDENQTKWFAFKEPREMGRLSYWALRISAAWRFFIIAGLPCLIIGLVKLFRDPTPPVR